MPLDEDAAAYLEHYRSPLHLLRSGEQTMASIRRDQARPVSARLPPLRNVVDVLGAGRTLRLYVPQSARPLPVVLYLHGGGWVFGSLETHHVVCAELAHRSGCLVASLDYRQPPEFPFPAALDDVWASLHWLHQGAREYGGDPARIGVAGDSAGGNLAAAAAIKARDNGFPLRAQLLIYPIVDDDFSKPSYVKYGSGFGLDAESMAWYWDQYSPQRSSPYASPLRCHDLSGVADAHIVSVEFDPLRDDAFRYRQALAEAGVSVTHQHEDTLIHGSLRLTGAIPAAGSVLAGATGGLRSLVWR